MCLLNFAILNVKRIYGYGIPLWYCRTLIMLMISILVIYPVSRRTTVGVSGDNKLAITEITIQLVYSGKKYYIIESASVVKKEISLSAEKDIENEIYLHKRQVICGEEFDVGSSGSIELPQMNNEYLPNMFCLWVIKSEPGSNVIFTSTYFEVEQSPNCKWDFLEIKDGGEETNGTISRFCGYENLAFISVSNTICVYFVSDGDFQQRGFHIDFRIIPSDLQTSPSGCNSSIEVDGFITSPDYPSNYPPLSDCYYLIQGEEDDMVELTISDINIADDTCLFDHIQVYDGDNTHSEQLSTLCGYQIPSTLQSTGRSIFVHFHSDYFQEGRGFKATVHFKARYPLKGIDASIQRGCKQVIDTQMSGQVTSPNYPRTYPNNRQCESIIRSPLPDHFIRLNVTFMDIEEGENCTFDYLEVFSDENQGKATSSGKLCGTSIIQNTMESKGETMKLIFSSDDLIGLQGFVSEFVVIPRDVCFPKCKENELCVRDMETFRCIFGSHCKENICENGKCVITMDGHRCYCPPGFQGTLCQHFGPSKTTGRSDLMFTKVPNDEHFRRGQRVVLECRVNDRIAKYTWLFGDLMIQSDVQTVEVLPGGVLDIKSFNENFEGVYKCLASTQTDFAEYSFRLTMVEDCNLDVQVPPRNIVTVEGSTALFSCYIPAATEVKWYKDDQLLIMSSWSYNDRISVLVDGHYLRLDSVSMTDIGRYTCTGRSDYRCYVERSATLSVTEKESKQRVCGQISKHKDLTETLSSRISGGQTVDDGSAPWHVIIRAKKQKKTFCGGSVISNSWIMTAGHCISHYEKEFHEPFVKDNIELYLGTEFCDGENGLKRKINQFIIHQNFSRRAAYDNDIALIELDVPVNFTEFIMPICMKTGGIVNDMFFARQVGKKVGRVMGCGREYENVEGTPLKLQDVYVPYVDRELCDQADVGHRNFTDSMICAGYDIAYLGDACYGDSGGSLTMQMTKDDPWVIVGIVSWGVGCDRSGHYGYYTNVAMFYDWIQQTITNRSLT